MQSVGGYDKSANMAKTKPLKLTAASRVIQAGGGYSVLARAVGVRRQAVASWVRHGVPQRHIAAVRRVLGASAWTEHDIRPDLYP